MTQQWQKRCLDSLPKETSRRKHFVLSRKMNTRRLFPRSDVLPRGRPVPTCPISAALTRTYRLFGCKLCLVFVRSGLCESVKIASLPSSCCSLLPAHSQVTYTLPARLRKTAL